MKYLQNHDITGSINITGSVNVSGNLEATASMATSASYAVSASFATTSCAASAETATIYSPEFTEETFNSGKINAITIDSFIQIYLDAGSQFSWRLASGVVDQKAFKISNYWRIFDSSSNIYPVQSDLIANSTTWDTMWKYALSLVDAGDTETLKLICVPHTLEGLGMYQADTRVYEIVCTVGSSYVNNKVYWRRVPKEQLLF